MRNVTRPPAGAVGFSGDDIAATILARRHGPCLSLVLMSTPVAVLRGVLRGNWNDPPTSTLSLAAKDVEEGTPADIGGGAGDRALLGAEFLQRLPQMPGVLHNLPVWGRGEKACSHVPYRLSWAEPPVLLLLRAAGCDRLALLALGFRRCLSPVPYRVRCTISRMVRSSAWAGYN